MSHCTAIDNGSVCRYPPFFRLVGFAIASGIGILAGIVQFRAVIPSGSSALLPEAVHALTDGAMLLPALVYSWRVFWGSKRRFNSFAYDRLADFMARVMLVTGLLSVAWAVARLGGGSALHAQAGIDSAVFGLVANAVQLALMLGCRSCRFHRLIMAHLIADTASSVLVVLDLGLELDRVSGMPIDSIFGIIIGGYLVLEGLKEGHSH